MIVSNVYPPPSIVVQAIDAATTRMSARVEIYEQDGITRWEYDTIPRAISGTVNADYTRDERRTIDLTLDNKDNVLKNAPGYFWYDKIIKVFKSVSLRTADFDSWEFQIGEFMIDSINEDHFPHQVKVTGRDYTKKCLNSKFVVTTAFSGPNSLEALIGALASNAGITKKILPTTGITVGKSFTYEPQVTRWQAMKDIANAYNYDIFFDSQGYLRMQLFPDPATQEPVYTFQTGAVGNLSSYSKATDDERLYNHVLVIGAATDTGIAPWAEAKNETPGSPTNIDEIGDRLYTYSSDFITTTAQAQTVADSFLSVHQLEQFNLNLSSLNHFYLDVGNTVAFIDPRPAPGDPTKFLLQTLDIPIELGLMSATAARVENVGGV